METKIKAPEAERIATAQRQLSARPNARMPRMGKLLGGAVMLSAAAGCYQSTDGAACSSVDLTPICTTREGITTCNGVNEGDAVRKDGKVFVVERITRGERTPGDLALGVQLEISAKAEVTCSSLGERTISLNQLAATMELRDDSSYRVWAHASSPDGDIVLGIANSGGSDVINLTR